MNLLLCYGVGFGLSRVSVILLFIIYFILINGITRDLIDPSFFVSMPVTTRSQAKRTAKSFKDFSHTSPSNSSKELSQNIIINSTKELSLLDSKTSSKDQSLSETIATPLSLVPVNNNNADTIYPLLPIESGCHCSLSSGSSFRNFKFENLEFSNPSVNVSSIQCHYQGCYNFMMEEDCKEPVDNLKVPRDEVNIGQLFTNLSNHITTQVTSIQDQIVQNKVEMSHEFQRIVQENEAFKGDIRAELDGFRQLLIQHQLSSQPVLVPTPQTTLPSPLLVVSPSVPDPQVSSQSTVVAPEVASDCQTQMMKMLTDSFSKLSTVLSEKKEDT